MRRRETPHADISASDTSDDVDGWRSDSGSLGVAIRLGGGLRGMKRYGCTAARSRARFCGSRSCTASGPTTRYALPALHFSSFSGIGWLFSSTTSGGRGRTSIASASSYLSDSTTRYLSDGRYGW